MVYVARNGIATSTSYPYTAVRGSCKQTLYPRVYPVRTGYINILNTNAALQTQLLKSPIAVAVDATQWQSYTSGVLKCTTSNVNHAVVLVGVTATGIYRLRNSWGTGWG